ncbi:Protein of unknown function (DUF3445) domain containing protein [Elaphomyces granulatus]
MVSSLPLTGFIVVIWVIRWLWNWLPSLLAAIRSKVPDSDVTHMAPYPCEPIKARAKFSLTMGLRRLNQPNWLTVDKNYVDEHWIRDRLLRENRQQVLQCLPESQAACEEMLEEVIGFLCDHFPGMFERKRRGSTLVICNKETCESFAFGPSNNKMEPLEIAARLAMEDLSILMPNEDGEYYLFMARLTPLSPMERSNYFVQTTCPNEDLFSVLFCPNGLSVDNFRPSPRDIVIRRERQTFRRLPRTDAIVFSVKTTLTALDELPPQELANLATEINHWPDDIARYKGRDIWGTAVLEFCEQRAGPQPEDS